jgi:dihydrofolate reductase
VVTIAFILAVARNGVIGRGGQLPWRLSTDLKRFRALTMGKPMIMGRKQYDSVGRPLDGRDNIVITRNRNVAIPGVIIVHDLDAALATARHLATGRGADEIMIIGGAEIFALALPHAARIYLTQVHADVPGDVVFHPPGPPDWQEVSREDHPAGPKDDYDFSYVLLERVRA